jgi:hypothetical protein
VHEFDVTFLLKGKPNISYSFDGVIEHEGVTIETRDGKICGKMVISVESGDYNLARERAIKEVEKLTAMLTIILGGGFTIEDIRVEHRPIIESEGRVKKITVFDSIVPGKEEVYMMKTFSRESLEDVKNKLKELTGKIGKLNRSMDYLKAIKWWAKGDLEEDKVDKFLDYFISFEMLASLKGYSRKKYGKEWARKFSEKYSITYRLGERKPITDIRNKIMHAPGPEKDEAEELAKQYADSFGRELLEAIKKILDEAPS